MYFVQYHPLKEKLRERTLSDGEALPYLVVWGVLGCVWAMLWQMYGNFNSFNSLDAFYWVAVGTHYHPRNLLCVFAKRRRVGI